MRRAAAAVAPNVPKVPVAALAESLAEGQRRGTDRRRRMATHVGIHIVIVEGVRKRTVDEGRIVRLGARIERDERDGAVRAAELLQQQRRQILARTRDRHAEPVEKCVLGPEYGAVRNLARRERT
jgi:hypothetical protein